MVGSGGSGSLAAGSVRWQRLGLFGSATPGSLMAALAGSELGLLLANPAQCFLFPTSSLNPARLAPHYFEKKKSV
jgi:hypothetical protein